LESSTPLIITIVLRIPKTRGSSLDMGPEKEKKTIRKLWKPTMGQIAMKKRENNLETTRTQTTYKLLIILKLKIG